MKKILAVMIIGIGILFMAGCPEDDRPVKYNDVTIHVQEEAAPTPTPEPTTMILLGSGLAGLGVYARKRFKK